MAVSQYQFPPTAEKKSEAEQQAGFYRLVTNAAHNSVAAAKYVNENMGSPLYLIGTLVTGFGFYALQDLKSDIKADIQNLKRDIDGGKQDIHRDIDAIKFDLQNVNKDLGAGIQNAQNDFEKRIGDVKSDLQNIRSDLSQDRTENQLIRQNIFYLAVNKPGFVVEVPSNRAAESSPPAPKSG